MIPPTDASAERFLADLDRILERAGRAQRQISSGLRVQNASDAPGEIAEILQLQTELTQLAQVQTNLVRTKTEVDSAEVVLQRAVAILERARAVATNGATSLRTAEERQIMAGEVLALQEELVALSRTTVDDRFIFSGDRDNAPSYELDLTAANGVNQLFTTAATRQIQDSSGVAFAVARTAQEIFDNPAGNAFAAINGLRVALENNDQAGLDDALDALRQAHQHVNRQLSFYGGLQSRIDRAAELARKFQLQRRADLSARRDADVTAATLELNEAGIHQETALAARARLRKTSLFDFLG